jgi:hypothetical protein
VTDADKYVTVALGLAVVGSAFSVAAVATAIAVITRVVDARRSLRPASAPALRA